MNSPAEVQARLNAIDADLALRQNVYEAAALAWYRVLRDREYAHAVAFLKASDEGSVTAQKARATVETGLMGKEEEALYESMKAVMRTLETRATIGMAILKSQGRA